MSRTLILPFFVLFFLIQQNSFVFSLEEGSEDVRQGVKVSEGFLMPMAPETVGGREFPKPAPYDPDELYKTVSGLCGGKGRPCIKKAIIDITKKHGARAAIDVYKKLMRDNDDLVDWAHHIAHHIGYFSVITFGAFPEILALCTEDFQYGCVHGFYQGAALSRQMDPSTAKQFSDRMARDASLSQNFVFSLYHGLGHFYMVSADYDIPKALNLCDGLSESYQTECYGGMFMENEDCALMGDWEKCGYSRENPLAPCSTLPSKYQEACYFNHTRWLLTLFDGHYEDVLDVCANIPDGNGSPCLQYLVQVVTEPNWQRNEISDGYPEYSPQTAIEVCRRFPFPFRNQCVNQTVVKFKDRQKWGKSQIKEFCDPFLGGEPQACFM